MENSKGPVCQSCGMPMQKGEDFGTNADGTKNREYCGFCFKDGRFVDEGITVEQKIATVVEIAKTQMKMPEEKAREMANNTIPKLRRWRFFPPTLSVFSPKRLNMFSEAATAPRKMSYLSARPLMELKNI